MHTTTAPGTAGEHIRIRGPKKRSGQRKAARGVTGGVRSIQRRAVFLREFVRSPGVVCAVAPSSRSLAKAMIDGVDFARVRTVVEYGPGTGTFTKAVVKALPEGWSIEQGGAGKFVAVEFNRKIAEMFAERYPSVRLHTDTAAHIVEICRAESIGDECGRGGLDLVISGLGWPSFNDLMRTEILEATATALRPGGEFRTFGYHCGLLMRGAWHFRREVKRLFREVRVGRVVWGNLPPAFVYTCIR